MRTSNLENLDPEGDRVAVGFRPSGKLHVGNLLSIGYAAVIADKLGLELDLMCCDTDWSAHIHENHKPENSDVMKLFFERSCGCGKHSNIAEHRVDEIKPFLKGLEQEVDLEVEVGYLSNIEAEKHYADALSNLLSSMERFDEVFGGGFRRRYRSPVTNVCGCGFSHSKGAAYSENTDELVFACRNKDCSEGFAADNISGKKGVYYLVDPVRDPGRDVAVHVFGGDYRKAEKEMKTSKIEKVEKITEIACGQTPDYFLAPMIADKEGKPLSKSRGTGKTIEHIDDLEVYGERLAEKIEEWITEEERFLSQQELLDV
ncbi:MAG: hypothetical protein H8Z69_05330 [Nanohaloarchaea archaeon]|nr:hypothetical protein [Candidatus Nanohaloarchaea archaeon]